MHIHFSYWLIPTLFPVSYYDIMNLLAYVSWFTCANFFGTISGTGILGERACTSATLLDNHCFPQQLANLHPTSTDWKFPLPLIFPCHFCHSYRLVFIKFSDVPTYIIRLSNCRCHLVSIQTIRLDVCPWFGVSGPCRMEPWPHLDICQKAGLKKENNSVVFSIKCWLTNRKKSWC